MPLNCQNFTKILTIYKKLTFFFQVAFFTEQRQNINQKLLAAHHHINPHLMSPDLIQSTCFDILSNFLHFYNKYYQL